MTGPGFSRDASLTTACAPVAPAAAAAFAAARFGVVGRAVPLSGERDSNFRILTGTGLDWVLKIANPAEDPAHVAMQIAALRHLGMGDPSLPVHTPRPASDGADMAIYESDGMAPRLAWMVRFLDGALLADVQKTPALRRDTGRMLARVARALADFSHPAADRVLLWDVARAAQVADLVPHVADDAMRQRVARVFAQFTEAVAPRLATLPAQIVHADFNLHNLLADPQGQRITGILDFGDMLRTARVADLAVAASYHVGIDEDPLAPVRDLVAGYESVLPLDDAERALLPALIATRIAMTITIGEWRASLYPENRVYLLRNNAAARQRLMVLVRSGWTKGWI